MTNQLSFLPYGDKLARYFVDEENNLWFAAKDICDALDIVWNSKTLNSIRDEWKGVRRFLTPRGEQEMVTISEAAVYKLAFRSRKPEAERFTDAVAEVVRQIRRTGRYESVPMGEPSDATTTPQLSLFPAVQAELLKQETKLLRVEIKYLRRQLREVRMHRRTLQTLVGELNQKGGVQP